MQRVVFTIISRILKRRCRPIKPPTPEKRAQNVRIRRKEIHKTSHPRPVVVFRRTVVQMLSQSIFLARNRGMWKLLQRCCNVVKARLRFIAKWSQAEAEARRYSSIVGCRRLIESWSVVKMQSYARSFFLHTALFPSCFFVVFQNLSNGSRFGIARPFFTVHIF